MTNKLPDELLAPVKGSAMAMIRANRRGFLRVAGGLAGLGAVGVTPVAAQGPPAHPPGRTNDRGNWPRGEAEELAVSEVLARTADPAADNFEEAFTFYRVTFEPVTYDTWVYREPSRLGGGNFVADELGGVTSSRFWHGVSAPDEDGIQHEIVHTGPADQYFETDDGWRSLVARFADGELLEVNGVEPVEG